MKKIMMALCAAGLMASAPVVAQAENLSIHGSTTVTANVFETHQSDIEASTGLTLDIVGNGSSRGVQDLLDGKAEMAMISSSLDSTKKKVEGEGIDTLQEHKIGISRVAFVVNPANPVSELTMEQVTSILKGETTNWSEVGGADMPIIIVTETSGGGIRSTVEKKLLEKASIAGNMKELPNGPQVVLVSAQLPPAFGVASAATAGDSVKTITTDKEIEQPLSFVTKGDADARMQKVIDASVALGLK